MDEKTPWESPEPGAPWRDPTVGPTSYDPFAPPGADPGPTGPMFPGQDSPGDGRTTARARAAIVIGVVALLLVVVGGVAVGVNALARFSAGAGRAAGATYVADLAAGDCYLLGQDATAADTIDSVDPVPCTDPHDGQVYALVPLTFETYPSDDVVTSTADKECDAKNSALVPTALEDDTITPAWYAPVEADWPARAHVAVCVIEAADDSDGLTRSWTTG